MVSLSLVVLSQRVPEVSRHPRAKWFHRSWEILSNQWQFYYMKETPKRWWVHLKWCSGLHLGLVQYLRKNRKPLSASISFRVENEQSSTILLDNQTFLWKNLVAQSNRFQGITRYNAQKIVWVVIQINTKVFRIKGNMYQNFMALFK